MIDITKAEIEFKKYIEQYDINNEKIKLKVIHTYRTVDVAEKIAESLSLEKEEIQLARLIGLLHDIGRFEQLRIYNTFNDRKSIDHADLGIKILFEDRLIEKFVEDRKYDNIIYKAIKNHNKYKIEEGLNEKEQLHAKIIKDADKTDIYAIHIKDIEENKKILYQDNVKQNVTPEVLGQFLKYELIDKKNCKNEIDDLIVVIAFVYDYFFEKGLEIVFQNQYIEKLLQQVEKYEIDEKESKLIRETVMNFLHKKIKRF